MVLENVQHEFSVNEANCGKLVNSIMWAAVHLHEDQDQMQKHGCRTFAATQKPDHATERIVRSIWAVEPGPWRA